MNAVSVIDLTNATEQAVVLSGALEQPTVVAGALAMAAHGYRRETSDVDIVLAVVVGDPSGDALESAAQEMGLTLRAKTYEVAFTGRHGFGGYDLRAGDVRINVLTLDRDVPALVPEAVKKAVDSDRRMVLFGHDVFVVSLGHLIAMKLVAERKKDIADIVELIKVRLEAGQWADDRAEVKEVVKRHLGWYAARKVDDLVLAARSELSG